MFILKKNIQDLKRIRGGSHRSKINKKLLLDRNERIIPLNKKTLLQLKNKILSNNLGYYPDLNEFYLKISNWLNFPVKNIFITEGLDGAIQSAFKSYTKENISNIIVPDPSFAMYQVYSKLFNVKLKTIDYNFNFDLNYKKIFKIADKNTSIIFLPNPNMPIEGFLENNKIEEVARFCELNNIMLFIDEVYFHFHKHTSINLTKKFKNLIIARSFSKAFGLAGIRLGYLISNAKNIKYISNTRSGYESNSLSIAIGSYFIDNYQIVKKYVYDIKIGLKYLKSELTKKKILYTSGEKANYIFIKLKNENSVQNVYKYLIKKNIYVRIGWKKPYNNFICVSASNEKNLKFFLKVFLKAKKLYE